ncbi:hypothetical protein [Streptomyces colonosanans]|uniref:hypothetical protein n=1 Tax=Streptomyces colonosanans TaxID=1428652 RepID=UPI000AA7F5FF|nr:hypothetical protein [Streptomyces colonosanans]
MRRARAAALPIVHPDLVEFYLAHRAAQGMNTDHKVRWGARALLAAVPDLSDFCRLPLERQLAFNHETHRFISWLSVIGRLQPGADYLVARRPRLGIVLARTEPELHLRFMETARSLGFRDALAMTQFNLLGHFVAWPCSASNRTSCSKATGTRDAACCWRPPAASSPTAGSRPCRPPCSTWKRRSSTAS